MRATLTAAELRLTTKDPVVALSVLLCCGDSCMMPQSIHDWGNVAPEMPRRLLHVPTMTSVELPLPGNPRPKYNILSYTWGRWRSVEFDSINIKGTPWKIPAVNPNFAFSPKQFEDVLRRVAKEVDYVWVDIACINQGRNPQDIAEGMDQIGKQMGIFKGAHEAYVWLHCSSNKQLEKIDESEACFYEFGYMLESLGKARHTHSHANPYDEGLVIETLDRAITALRSWTSDPWFSSLWTLQESVLRRDAIILSCEGETVPPAGKGTPKELRMAGNFLRNILQILCGSLQEGGNSPVLLKKLSEARDEIRSNVLAFMRCGNPNVPFGLAKHRTTNREEDRIYGIMQVYGLRLGKTVEPDKSFTLEQLKDQLSIRLNERCPVVAQMFVHSQTPRAGRSWQITQECWVPSPFISCELRAREANDCSVSVDANMRAVITGRAWPLADIIPVLEVEWNWGNLILDCNSNIGNASWKSIERGDPQSLEIADERLRERCDEVRRALSNSLDNVLPVEELILVYMGRIQSYDEQSVHLGLVLLRQQEFGNGSHLWVRAGICSWRGGLEQLPPNPIGGDFGVM